ncbi:1-aminocyclopropane-1-carboxylate deaminase/D-cysteine desulfhydrase [Methylomonas koyamae]|uniref:1-aminocyclopropane-1-carboxylate deaminase/D-cysteine desulfhydrase n=1 Tax=Methylomonas koyamae TaxID=702114 RepID=UPI002873964E|nr:pyridoxal-phosphate dependent enzyme [Methylomonas koyamae]WNB77633.1 pyridoxal-phosphate dependent enzyme [Methylomonas koyamae]
MSGLHPRLKAFQTQLQRSPLTRIDDPIVSERGIRLWLKRDDLLHPVVSGNKWRKLKYILNDALHRGADTVISMGGAYSNHLHALAFVGRALGLNTVGFIRGERPLELNPTLLDLIAWGMELRFVSRRDYRQLRGFKTCDSLPGLKPDEYWLAEGGATALALQGVAESAAEIDVAFDTLAVACGTGTTLAGLIGAAPASTQLIGVAALKGGGFLTDDIAALLNRSGGADRAVWRVLTDYHCGGFARTTPQLLDFIADFQRRHAIELEPVYTGKLLYALYDLIRNGYFPAGHRIVAVHTGGLQGKRSET